MYRGPSPYIALLDLVEQASYVMPVLSYRRAKGNASMSVYLHFCVRYADPTIRVSRSKLTYLSFAPLRSGWVYRDADSAVVDEAQGDFQDMT